MTRLDWSKAKTRSRHRAAVHSSGDPKIKQAAFQAFVEKHDLACFKCNTRTGPWAAARRTAKGHHWAICTTCITNTKSG